MKKTRETNKKAHGRKRGGAGKAILIALLIVVMGLAAFVIKFVYDINNPASLFGDTGAPPTADFTPETSPTLAPTLSPEATATPEPTPTVDPITALTPLADTEFMKNKVNILVLGVDESTEREAWGSFRTDTMILVTVNFETNDVNMLSIPRDSLVKLYNEKGELLHAESPFPYAKINSAFSEGGGAQKKGYAYAATTVSMTLGGIPVNYYIGFNMNVVKAVVDAMGGVDYDVDVEVTMNGRKLYPGPQHLNGQNVLDYCRQRKGSSDLARIDRQQRMLMAIVSQLKSTGQIANIPQIYTAVEQNVQTNLSLTQIASLALLGARMDIAQLTRATVPNKPQTVHSLSCVLLENEKLAKLMKKVFGKNIELDPQLDVTYINELLAVLDYTPPPYYYVDENGNIILPPATPDASPGTESDDPGDTQGDGTGTP
ncbi:MAG: LCP family protein [Clostridiaceae bacterium]|nr:LCP family protein [Eubacteriales bacterium]